MATNQLKVFLMLFWDYFGKKRRMQDLKVINDACNGKLNVIFDMRKQYVVFSLNHPKPMIHAIM